MKEIQDTTQITTKVDRRKRINEVRLRSTLLIVKIHKEEPTFKELS